VTNREVDISSRFYDNVMYSLSDNQLVCSDVLRLVDDFTHCKDDGSCTSWIDHVLCRKTLDDKVTEISVQHKPLSVKLANIRMMPCKTLPAQECHHNVKYDWDNADTDLYMNAIHVGLSTVNIPRCLLDCSHSCHSTDHFSAIDEYYSSLVTCIRDCTRAYIHACSNHNKAFTVPGWTDHVKDKHDIARASFLEWVAAGKPRSGCLLHAMCRTRAEFKLALQHCKAAEEQTRADATATALASKYNVKTFWKGTGHYVSATYMPVSR